MAAYKQNVPVLKLSSQMALFTLPQKVFIIKCYYKTGQSPNTVLECLGRRYGIKYNSGLFVYIPRFRKFPAVGQHLMDFTAESLFLREFEGDLPNCSGLRDHGICAESILLQHSN